MLLAHAELIIIIIIICLFYLLHQINAFSPCCININNYLFLPSVAPLNEDDYSQADDHSDFSASQLKKSGLQNGLGDSPVAAAARSKIQVSML